MTWHAPADVLDRFARHPEDLGDTTASSVEQHLLACAACRASVAASVVPDELERSWAAIADVVDRPAAPLLERVLVRAGLAGDVARLVGATGALQVAWLFVVVGLTMGALAASGAAGTSTPFFLVAPLLPLGAVALAFLPILDPAGEAGVATALHGWGVALRRVLATAGPTVVILALATPALPAERVTSAAWLLPALALTCVGLVLATVVRVSVAVASAALLWVVAIWIVRVAQRGDPFVETAAFGGNGQLLWLAVAAASTVVLVARRERFATMEVGW